MAIRIRRRDFITLLGSAPIPARGFGVVLRHTASAHLTLPQNHCGKSESPPLRSGELFQQTARRETVNSGLGHTADYFVAS